MNKKTHYTSLGISVFLLLGIGLALDRVGGLSIRTDDSTSSVNLSFSEPAVVGVPLLVRWQKEGSANIGVALRLVSGEHTHLLGEGQFLEGAMTITLPCQLSPAPYRLELFDVLNDALLGVQEIQVLPPGPDCVR